MEPVVFANSERIEIAGRGTVLYGPYPFETGEGAMNRIISAEGKRWRVRGVERFALLREVQKGEPVGLLVLAMAS